MLTPKSLAMLVWLKTPLHHFYSIQRRKFIYQCRSFQVLNSYCVWSEFFVCSRSIRRKRAKRIVKRAFGLKNCRINRTNDTNNRNWYSSSLWLHRILLFQVTKFRTESQLGETKPVGHRVTAWLCVDKNWFAFLLINISFVFRYVLCFPFLGIRQTLSFTWNHCIVSRS